MAFKTKTFINGLKRYKKGLIVGAAVGFIAATYAISQGHDLNTITQAGEGVLDSLMGRESLPIEIAKYKLYAAFMFLGTTVGFFVDKYLPRFNKKKPSRKRRRR